MACRDTRELGEELQRIRELCENQDFRRNSQWHDLAHRALQAGEILADEENREEFATIVWRATGEGSFLDVSLRIFYQWFLQEADRSPSEAFGERAGVNLHEA